MTYVGGIDVGAAFTKVVLLEETNILASSLMPSGGHYQATAEKVMAEALSKASLSFDDIACVVATGYGASKVSFAGWQVTDVSCQARGIYYLFPSVRTIIDIGGQSSKVIKVDDKGGVVNFVVSEKCAAGSGRFLQVIARVLGIELNDIGPLSLKAQKSAKFSTSCAVFAESETISRIAEGTPKEEILAGVHKAMAAKIFSLVNRLGMENNCALTGGGAKDTGLVKSVAEALGAEVSVPGEPQTTAALGAALLAKEKRKRNGEEEKKRSQKKRSQSYFPFFPILFPVR